MTLTTTNTSHTHTRHTHAHTRSPATRSIHLPRRTIISGAVSSAQLEAVVYANQQHELFLADRTRRGFLIGDGAGVGKGREIAAIILENLCRLHTSAAELASAGAAPKPVGRDRVAVWFSINTDLATDATRDLRGEG